MKLANYSTFIGPDPIDYSDPIEIGPITQFSSDRKTIFIDGTNFLPPGSVVPNNAYILVLKDPVGILWCNGLLFRIYNIKLKYRSRRTLYG